jgi:hypothetical protein
MLTRPLGLREYSPACPRLTPDKGTPSFGFAFRWKAAVRAATREPSPLGREPQETRLQGQGRSHNRSSDSVVRIGSCFLAVAAVFMTLLAGAVPSAMAEEGKRVLDPQLSLIGGCKAEELDPIEDPGCPGTAGHPPAGFFAYPNGVAVDLYGDIYVASKGKQEDGSEGRIDIFGPQGNFISEIPKGEVLSPQAIAVDSEGTLYVWSEFNGVERGPSELLEGELLRFDPCLPYDPASGQIEYCNPPTPVTLAGPDCPEVYACTSLRRGFGVRGLAIDPENDHLFLKSTGQIVEYGSAAEGNEEIRTDLKPAAFGQAVGIALDAAHDRFYVQEGVNGSDEESAIGIYALVEGLPAGEEYEKIGSIPASAVPQGNFGSRLSFAVDEGNGHLYAYDTENIHLWEFDQNGNYVGTVEFPFQSDIHAYPEIAIDNGPYSPNGKLGEEAGKGRYLFVPSYPKKTPGHLFAFLASTADPPEVKSVGVADISEGEAELQAKINPGNLGTSYVFEFSAEGASGWTQAGTGTIAAGNLDVEVSTAVTGLAPGTHYRFRVVATNDQGSDEAKGSFSTYPSLLMEPSPCANALLRTGFSSHLPDCRAYELVTPADTNARAPVGEKNEGGGGTTRQVSPAGDKVPFRILGGALPGFNATGGLFGDPYLATRTATGWSTSYKGPTGAEAGGTIPGTTSPDQGYSFWEASGSGSAVVEGKFTFYVRYPDDHSELLGQGSLGIDPEATGRLISDGGGHIIFTTGNGPKSGTAVQLEPDAPARTQVVYDRTPDGITHVVSLKPGNFPFSEGEDAAYEGASPDGVGVAFQVGDTLYLRYKNETTFEIGEGVRYAGIAEGGGRVFYVKNGNLEAFDVATGKTILFADTAAEVIPVIVSNDGSAAYFISKSSISGSGPNPLGAKPQAGGENLYRSKEGQISFVATVTTRDVVGNSTVDGGDGLGLWLGALESPALGRVPARSTPDGAVFLFKSRAELTGYDSEGYAEIYRYDAAAKKLSCLSCNPTGTPARSDATLQSQDREGSELYSALSWPENLRADGRRAFFESSEPLVARDVDGLQDVYEWEDQGVGSCTQAGGCLYLISSPQSRRNEYLWAVSRSGDDVFFLSSDLLVGADTDETPSIYDARVGGGFAEPGSGACPGEGCRPQLSTSPSLSSGNAPVQGRGDNVKRRVCPKGKHKVKRHGKVRCVRKKAHRRHRHHPHHRTGSGQKGARR